MIFKNITIKKNTTLINAFKKLTKNGQKCLVVIDNSNHLIGTLSDGDLRKSILKGVSFNKSVKDIYNKKPIFFTKENFTLQNAKKIFLKNKFDLIPIVDNKNFLVDIILWDKIFSEKKIKTNYKQIKTDVVIMAGGKGQRLEPFTKILPKPLIPINNKSVIELIINNFLKYKLNNFYISINYKGKIIKAFFEEQNPKYNFTFVEENKPLGTIGSLSKLKYKLKENFFLTNCDIILDFDYHDLYTFHKKNKYDITIVAASNQLKIPYGICEVDEQGLLNNFIEKPSYEFLINTGFYVINKKTINLIPKNKNYNFNNFIADLKKNNSRIGVYPINERAWIDVGEWAEFKKAVEKFNY